MSESILIFYVFYAKTSRKILWLENKVKDKVNNNSFNFGFYKRLYEVGDLLDLRSKNQLFFFILKDLENSFSVEDRYLPKAFEHLENVSLQEFPNKVVEALNSSYIIKETPKLNIFHDFMNIIIGERQTKLKDFLNFSLNNSKMTKEKTKFFNEEFQVWYNPKTNSKKYVSESQQWEKYKKLIMGDGKKDSSFKGFRNFISTLPNHYFISTSYNNCEIQNLTTFIKIFNHFGIGNVFSTFNYLENIALFKSNLKQNNYDKECVKLLNMISKEQPIPPKEKWGDIVSTYNSGNNIVYDILKTNMFENMGNIPKPLQFQLFNETYSMNDEDFWIEVLNKYLEEVVDIDDDIIDFNNINFFKSFIPFVFKYLIQNKNNVDFFKKTMIFQKFLTGMKENENLTLMLSDYRNIFVGATQLNESLTTSDITTMLKKILIAFYMGYVALMFIITFFHEYVKKIEGNDK